MRSGNNYFLYFNPNAADAGLTSRVELVTHDFDRCLDLGVGRGVANAFEWVVMQPKVRSSSSRALLG